MSAPLPYNTLTTTSILPTVPAEDITEATTSETTTALDWDQMNDNLMEHTEHGVIAAEPHLQCQENELVMDDGEELTEQSASAPVVSDCCPQADANSEGTDITKPCRNSPPSTDDTL